MKILIIGGAIFLGRHLIDAAQARGHEVTIFNRGLHDSGVLPEVERIKGDRTGDLSELSGRRWDAVIDTCGFTPNVVRASARLLSENAEHYTFISSQSVYANFEKAGIDESYAVQELTGEQVTEAEAIVPSVRATAVTYGELYGGLKALCEQAAEAEMPGRALSIRAGLIVGTFDYSGRFAYWVRRVASGGEVLAPSNPSQPVQLVDGRDLALWIVKMSEQRQAGIYNATGPESKLTLGEMLEAFRKEFESDAKFTWASEQFLIDSNVQGWTEMPLWLPSEDNIANFFSVDTSKAINAGLSFRPLAETARDTLAWERMREGESELKAGMNSEREKELLKSWHESEASEKKLEASNQT